MEDHAWDLIGFFIGFTNKMTVNSHNNKDRQAMKFQAQPINFIHPVTQQIQLKPLKKQIDRKVDKILAYLTHYVPIPNMKNSCSQLHKSTQCQFQTQWEDAAIPASAKRLRKSKSGKINLSEYLERHKVVEEEVHHEQFTHIDDFREEEIPVKEKVMRIDSQISENSQESLSKKNIQEESFSRIFCGNDPSTEMPQPFSLNINLDNITNRSPQFSQIGYSIKSTDRSQKKIKPNKENQYKTPYVSNSKKKGLLNRTPSCSTIRRQFQPEGRPTHPCVNTYCLAQMQEEVAKHSKNSRKQPTENNLRGRLLKRIQKIPNPSVTRNTNL